MINNKHVLINDNNYHKIGIGSKVSYPGNPDQFCVIFGVAKSTSNYPGDWLGNWCYERMGKNPGYFNLKFFKDNKYYMIVNKPRIVIL